MRQRSARRRGAARIEHLAHAVPGADGIQELAALRDLQQPGGPGFGAQQQQRPLLGVSGSEDAGGVRVQQVQPGSAAERAGVKAGDVIVRADGRDTPTVDALRSAVGGVDATKQRSPAHFHVASAKLSADERSLENVKDLLDTEGSGAHLVQAGDGTLLVTTTVPAGVGIRSEDWMQPQQLELHAG